MKKLLLGLLLFGFVFYTLGAQIRDQSYRLMLKGLLSHTVPEILPNQLAATSDSVVLLDTREREEYEVSHLRHARWVGYDDFDLSRVSDLPKNQKIVTYCSVGYRSEKIAEKLRAVGFTDVSNLYGGIFEWKNEGYPVFDDSGVTEKVHAFDRVWGIWLRKGEKVY
ncbi:MAG: rhodanese-like domain-containing protein [Bacteroidetes bacterium]|nr:MAG: rhodanese-like domain-containing protein [Bacteroidota bacterium]